MESITATSGFLLNPVKFRQLEKCAFWVKTQFGSLHPLNLLKIGPALSICDPIWMLR
jgi:hypothetical protein